MDKMPLSIQILTNLNCNLACTYCYENKGRGANDVYDIVKFIEARYRDAGIAGTEREVILEFIGGESLLYPEMLDAICTYAREIHEQYKVGGALTVSLTTNGTLIAGNKDVQDFLLKWRPHLGFSIDGTKGIHDACRIYPDGQGSYDAAVAGLKWSQQHMCPYRMGVKGTYTHETIAHWAEGVINLIDLGFTEIAANVVFEEDWTLEDGAVIFGQMKQVVDYLFEKGLQDKVHVFQINNKGYDMLEYGKYASPKTQNHCGTCNHMQCIGFDGLVYGCNRFCTMKKPIPIGHLAGTGEIIIDRQDFCEEIASQYEQWPDECKECPYGEQCPSCSAIPYEQNGPVEFFARKSQCGFTHAMVAARLYFRFKLGLLGKQPQNE